MSVCVDVVELGFSLFAFDDANSRAGYLGHGPDGFVKEHFVRI